MKRARSKMGLLLVLGMLTALLPMGALTPAAALDVHISEFHYDNDGTDVGEFVEVAGDAGTDLTDWTVALYNGSNGQVYNTINLDVTIDDEGAGIGAVDFQLPSNGIQNGAPDGLALVDDTGTLVEFLSYEGVFAATSGPANGVTSTDVGVSESGSTAVGQSLQLLGGIWVVADADPGLINGTPPLPTVNVTEFHYDNAGGDVGEFIEVTGDAGADLTGWSLVLYNGATREVYRTIDLTGTTIDDEGTGLGALDFAATGLQNGAPDGFALVNPRGEVVEFYSYEGTPFVAADGPAAGMTSVDVGVEESGSTPVGESLQLYNGLWTGPMTASPGVINTGPPPPPADAVITEFHYDNTGGDTGEFIEVTGNAGGDLTGWSLVLYNGSTGGPYNTIALTGFIDDEGAGIGAVDFAAAGLQNGAPDGIALTDDTGALVQFLSYEGSFTGVGGPANGVASVDVGVSEPGSTPVGQSLQLIGTTWTGPADASRGDVNPVPLPTVFISELHYDNAGADTAEFVEVTGDAGADLTDWSVALYNGANGQTYGTVALSGTIDDEDGVSGAVSFAKPGIQNGPDGLALINPDGDVVEFISYEDSFAATNGPALGMTSTDIGVSEPSSTPEGESLQLVDGSWIGPVEASPGLLNVAPPRPLTPIYTIQGSGPASDFDGDLVAIEGVVTSDQQGADLLKGFFVQDVAGDGDSATSDGIFVYDLGSPVDVNVGDLVRVEGTVDEFYGLTEITDVTSVAVTGSASVLPKPVNLPWASFDEPEQYEGMLITLPQTLVISEYFNFDRYGEIVLTMDRAMQPTAVHEPGSPEAAALDAANQLARVTLDDNRTSQNPDPAIHPNGDPFTMTNRFRGGDTVANVTGVMHYSFGEYKLQPTQGADYTAANPRPAAAADVGGSLKVASFNVLNYFTTLDYSSGDPLDNKCGPLQNQGCRGADANQPMEFDRQRAKIIAAIAEIDADIVGLMEIENFAGGGDHASGADDEPLADLVAGLNAAGAGPYAYVDTGPIGDDVIKVAFIYKPGTVTLSGLFGILDSDVDARFNDEKNRPALAQTFTETATGESVTVVVNHLKSKGSPCGAGDDDPEAGSCNLTRTLAAQALADWLANPANGFDDDVLIIGDLNAYDKEDPIDALVAAGYSDLVHYFQGENAYSYVFSGEWGYLDYAMANTVLQPKVTGTTVWHINADEPDLIDYDTSFKKDAQDALYAPDAYRSSDHDPVIVGLDLAAPEVSAELDRIWAGYTVGLFEVDFSCVDSVDPDPECVADINGITVEDGQRVLFIKSRWGKAWSKMIGNTLFIKDRDFVLTVIGTDDAGNEATATAEPTFRKWRRWSFD